MKKLLIAVLFIGTLAMNSTVKTDALNFNEINTMMSNLNGKKEQVDGWIEKADTWLADVDQNSFFKPYAEKLRAKIQEYKNNPQAGFTDVQNLWNNKPAAPLTEAEKANRNRLDRYEVGP